MTACPDCAEHYHCGSCPCCTSSRDAARGLFDTQPVPDPKQAAREAELRWARGAFEIVRDPLGRVA